MGLLSGVKILDLSHVWAGPLAVRYLADLGAEVVRVEAPYGRGPQEALYSPLGGWLGGAPGEDPWNNNAIFVKLMRNRRSVCLDLKLAEGKAAFLDLVREADVLLENFSAHAMTNLGLGYEALKQVNPQLIYVAMPGFGSHGELADRVAFGPTVEAMSGLTDVFGYSDDEPRNTAMALMDPITGLHGFAAVVTALQRVKETSRGVHMELSLHEGGVCYSGPWLVDQQLGNETQVWGNKHPNMVPHGVYACAGHDQWLALACVDDAQWRALVSLVGAESLDPSWDFAQRRLAEADIDRAITDFCLKHTVAAAVTALQTAGVPSGAVNDTPAMVADEHTQARGFFQPLERHATPVPGNPIKMQSIYAEDWTPCPKLGEHNLEVLSEWLGYSQQKVEALESQGVLWNKPPT